MTGVSNLAFIVTVQVTFSAEVTVTECPKNRGEWKQTLSIYPAGLAERLQVTLDIICECECENAENEVCLDICILYDYSQNDEAVGQLMFGTQLGVSFPAAFLFSNIVCVYMCVCVCVCVSVSVRVCVERDVWKLKQMQPCLLVLTVMFTVFI